MLPAFGPTIGLSQAERERYDFSALIRGSIGATKLDLSFYAECSEAVAAKLGVAALPGRTFIPQDVLARRTMTTASGAAGGYLVGTEIGDFASALRARSVIANLPIRKLPGLVGNVTIPRGVTNATMTWLGSEVAAPPEGDPTFGQLSMVPHTVSAVVDLGRAVLHGAGNVGRSFVEAELGAAAGQALDVALLAGTGAEGQPSGVIRASGVTNQSGTSLAWSGVCAMLKVAETYGDQESVRWVAGVDAAEILRIRERATGSGFILDDGRIASRGALVTNAMPAAALMVAPWDSVVMGEWGALELVVTPYASAAQFRAGIVSARLMWTVDFVPRQPASISKAESIT